MCSEGLGAKNEVFDDRAGKMNVFVLCCVGSLLYCTFSVSPVFFRLFLCLSLTSEHVGATFFVLCGIALIFRRNFLGYLLLFYDMFHTEQLNSRFVLLFRHRQRTYRLPRVLD